MNNFLTQKKIWVFDGAMGTMLQYLGIKTETLAEELNLNYPEVIFKIHDQYVKAGSDIIQSNTFGGSYLRLKHFNLEKKIYEINKRGIEIARQAAGKNVLVAASIGPSGKILEPFGEISITEAFDSFCKQLSACDEADIINIETMQSINEAEIAVKAAQEVLNNKPIFVSITFQKNPQGYTTIWGDSIKSVIEKMESMNIDVIGSNCGDGFEQFVDIIKELGNNTKIPTMAKPNAGIPIIKENKIFYPEKPELIEDKVERLIEYGVKIIGGCCGTTPQHIQVIRKIVDKYLN